MKIPKYIVSDMHKAAKLYLEANELMRKIESFFERKGIYPDELKESYEIDFEKLKCGNDVTDELVEHIKKEYTDF